MVIRKNVNYLTEPKLLLYTNILKLALRQLFREVLQILSYEEL